MNSFKKISILLFIFMQSLSLWAQDKKIDVNLNVDKGQNSNWYLQPWVWVVGGAIFILLLVALLKSNKSKD